MDELWSPTQLGVHVDKTEAVLAQWRYLGRGPRFIKVGRSVRYRKSDVEAWLNGQTMQRTGCSGQADPS